jgi:alkanesulfonate monooxygenase SsuD/methylene tetrahydromethanopterin reductase-like flavin-dependent oxidoreductase (luciferase family)
LQGLSRAQRWDEMAALVDDEMLDAYAVIGTYDEIAAKLRARFAGLATHLEFRVPVAGDADKARLRELLTRLRQ